MKIHGEYNQAFTKVENILKPYIPQSVIPQPIHTNTLKFPARLLPYWQVWTAVLH